MSMKNKKIRRNDGFSASKNFKRRSLLPKEKKSPAGTAFKLVSSLIK